MGYATIREYFYSPKYLGNVRFFQASSLMFVSSRPGTWHQCSGTLIAKTIFMYSIETQITRAMLKRYLKRLWKAPLFPTVSMIPSKIASWFACRPPECGSIMKRKVFTYKNDKKDSLNKPVIGSFGSRKKHDLTIRMVTWNWIREINSSSFVDSFWRIKDKNLRSGLIRFILLDY